jgi:hypothetical protein
MSTEPQDRSWEVPEAVWRQQSPHGTPTPQSQLPKRAGRGIGCAIVVIVAVGALLVVGGLIYGGVTLYSMKDKLNGLHLPGMHNDQFQTVDGLHRVLDLTRKRFGDTIGYDLTVLSTSFSVERALPDNPQRKATYFWYSWKGDFVDPTAIMPIMDRTPPVDLGGFSPEPVLTALHDAPSTLHVDPSAVKTSMLMIRPAKETPGVVEVDVMLDTTKGTGQVLLTSDGRVKQTIADW